MGAGFLKENESSQQPPTWHGRCIVIPRNGKLTTEEATMAKINTPLLEEKIDGEETTMTRSYRTSHAPWGRQKNGCCRPPIINVLLILNRDERDNSKSTRCLRRK